MSPRGQVNLEFHDDRMILATVAKSSGKRHQVTLFFVRDGRSWTVYSNCTCARYAAIYECHHLAATIIAADSVGASDQLPSEGQLQLEPIDGHLATELFGEVGERIEQNFRKQIGRGRGGKGKKKNQSREPAKAPLAAWKASFARLRTAVLATPAEPAPARHGVRRKAKQFLYAIDLRETAAQGKRPSICFFKNG